jgi:hypothetical protein
MLHFKGLAACELNFLNFAVSVGKMVAEALACETWAEAPLKLSREMKLTPPDFFHACYFYSSLRFACRIRIENRTPR